MSLCYQDGLPHFTPFIPLFILYRSLYITKKGSVRERDSPGHWAGRFFSTLLTSDLVSHRCPTSIPSGTSSTGLCPPYQRSHAGHDIAFAHHLPLGSASGPSS